MLNLLSHKSRNIQKSQLSRIVQDLAAFHAELASDFDSLACRYDFRVISCFQKEPESLESDSYDVVSTRALILPTVAGFSGSRSV